MARRRRAGGERAPASAESTLRRHASWILVALAYLVVFPYFEALNNPNENVRVWTTKALVDHGTFAINEVEARWGEVSDRATMADGRRTSSKAPGATLLGAPVLFVADKILGEPSKRATVWILRVFAVALPLAAFFAFFSRRVQQVTGSAWARDLIVVGLGLGTMMYSYGLLFVGHALAAACAVTAFLLVPRQDERSSRSLALAGLVAGLSVMFEYQAIVAALVVALYALATHRQRAWPLLAGALLPAILLGLYHAALFGSPWALPYGHLDNPTFREFHQQGVFGLGAPRAKALVSMLFSPAYGLFFFSPFLLLGVAGALLSLRGPQRAQGLVVLATATGMVLFVAGMSNWRGGWCGAGPRYAAAAVPFLAWGVVLGWNDLFARRLVPGLLLAALVVTSVLLAGAASAHFPHYPLVFDNPVFEVTATLVGEGRVPYGLGRLLGLRGALVYLPLFLIVAVAVALAVRAPERRRLVALGALALAVVLVLAASLPGRRLRGDEARALNAVRQMWEPR